MAAAAGLSLGVMFRRLRHLGQAFLLVTFAALLVFLFGWRETQPSVGPSAAPRVLQGRAWEAGQQEGQSTPGNMPPPLLDLFEQQREAVPLDPRENDLLYRPPLDVAFIFTHARDNWSLQVRLLLLITTVPNFFLCYLLFIYANSYNELLFTT